MNAPPTSKEPDTMTPIAAYYVMVNTDRERAPRFDSVVPRRSLAERILAALDGILHVRRAATPLPA